MVYTFTFITINMFVDAHVRLIIHHIEKIKSIFERPQQQFNALLSLWLTSRAVIVLNRDISGSFARFVKSKISE